MLHQKSRIAGRPASATPAARRKGIRPPDSRARVVRRPAVPRPANDNQGLPAFLRLRRPVATLIVVTAVATAIFALMI